MTLLATSDGIRLDSGARLPLNFPVAVVISSLVNDSTVVLILEIFEIAFGLLPFVLLRLIFGLFCLFVAI